MVWCLTGYRFLNGVFVLYAILILACLKSFVIKLVSGSM